MPELEPNSTHTTAATLIKYIASALGPEDHLALLCLHLSLRMFIGIARFSTKVRRFLRISKNGFKRFR